MTNMTIPLPDDRLAKLQELAARLRISPEELVRVSIEELLERPDEAFEQAARHILKKDEDLYRRLA
jgi:predicted transcriptional regulator